MSGMASNDNIMVQSCSPAPSTANTIADSNVLTVTADVHPCRAPTVSASPGHVTTCINTQAVLKAQDITEIDFDAITFADDADAHAHVDLNTVTREDTLHDVSNEMTPADDNDDLITLEDTLHHVSNEMTLADRPVAGMETPTSKTNQRKTKLSTLQSWNYDWLAYEQDGSYVTMVWCRICKAHHNAAVAQGSKKQNQLRDLNAYIKGTANVKKDMAKCHEKSNLHLQCRQESNKKPEVPAIKRSLTKLTDETRQKMCRLVDWAYTVAYCELPFTVFATLLNTEKKHGVNLGQTYTNDKACQNFIGEIGGDMVDALQELFKQEPFYCSLIFDGSCDKSISEKEVISVKLIEGGLPVTKLLGITEPGRCNAQGIHSAITDKCQEMHLELNENCVATAADGASVNFGRHSGVLTTLQSDMPWLVKIHCVAHRLELALNDSLKESYYCEIDQIMMQLYYMYRRSTKKWKELQAVGEALEENVVKPVRAQGTRWVDHRRKAVLAISRNYTCLITQFEDMASGERSDITGEDQAIIKGYLRQLKSHKFVLYLHSYRDLLEDQ